MRKIILSIEGMTRSACSNGLEKYLNKQNGIINASVNLVMANATIDYDENILDQEKIERYVKQAGFVSLGVFKELKLERKVKNEKIKLVIFTGLAFILIYISMGHMFGIPTFVNPKENSFEYIFILLVLTSLFLIYGFDILKNGFKNLIHRIPNMDTLVTIGVLSSFIYSLYGVVMILNGDYDYLDNLYFESAAIVIYFIKLGRFLEGISSDKTKEAIKKLIEITPQCASVEIDGKEKIVTLDEIKKGDILISKPGEKIAVDGEIIEGMAHLDETFITGESKPSVKKVGEKVIAGSFNYDGFVRYRAEKIGRESTVSEIVRLVLEASNTKAPIAKIADRILGYFVPAVMAIAIISFGGYLLLGYDISIAVSSFVTILVVACPCSLGLATPLAMVVSEGICASNGILVKKSEVLEMATKIDTVVFDKTGTLTYGKLKISEIQNYSDLADEEVIRLAGSLEAKSTHPIGKAFVDYMVEKKQGKLPVRDVENIAGYGIVGKIQKHKIILGNRKIVTKYGIKNEYVKEEERLSLQGNSIVYVIRDAEIIALIGVNDIVRENAKEVIGKLNSQKIQTIMLTGDNKEIAKKVATELKITKVIADVSPVGKAEIIKKMKLDCKKVMMCGDGINDSPALAKADIGVSVQSGTDIALDSADVILTKNDLHSILKLINISKKTVRNIKQNLFWAFFYNGLMIPVAIGFFKPIGIFINPMIASLAMVLSSLTVIANTLLLKNIKDV